MHAEGFAGVRNFLLENSRVIIQDDSGIPLRSFPKGWTVDCYGRYRAARGDVREISISPISPRFTTSNPPPPELGFAFGYHWQKDRGLLMMATRK